MDALMQDFRYAFRQLRARPGFATVVIVTLALGIGVNVAVFSLANWVMLRPVPGVTDPARLVTIQFHDQRGRYGNTSYPNLRDLRTRVPALASLAGVQNSITVGVQVPGARPSLARADFVSTGYFQALGVRQALGHAFTAGEEATADVAPVAVVSHDFWAGPLHADPAIVGKYIIVWGFRTQIVGVAPAGFQGSELRSGTELWIPGSAALAMERIPFGAGAVAPFGNREIGLFFTLVGRLAPSATVATAQAQLLAATAELGREFPQDNGSWSRTPPEIYPGVAVAPMARGRLRQTFEGLAAIAGLVLLVACANVANLFLFRAVARRQALGVRRALGASSLRLLRAELAESLLVAVMGGIAGIIPAAVLLRLARGPLFANQDVAAVHVDGRVLGFAIAVTLCTGLLAGLAPALAALRMDITPLIKPGARTQTSARQPGRSALAVAQLAIALALTVTTFLLVRTVRTLEHVDVGFAADQVSMMDLEPLQAGYPAARARQILLDMANEVARQPGIEGAALSAYQPFTFSSGDRVRPSDATTDSGTAVTNQWVSPAYFATMGIHLLRGRTFDESEEFLTGKDSSYHVAILSETLARRLFGNADPIGRIVVSSHAPTVLWSRVIGVVSDSRWASLTDEGAGPMRYQPLPAFAGSGALAVRSQRPLNEVQRAVDTVAATIAPAMAVGKATLLRASIDRSFGDQRLLSRALSVFGGLALTLAAIGLYGIMATAVAERAREFGIRMALGAQVAHILSIVLRRGAVLGGLGLVAGIVGAVALSKVVASRLYGVSPTAPGTYVLAALVLFVVVMGASVIPAWRAARVDPAQTLRAE